MRKRPITTVTVIISTFLGLFFFNPPPLISQEAPPPLPQNTKTPQPENAPTAEDFIENPDAPFTGTLADDDPENKSLAEDANLFGEEEADKEDEGEEPAGPVETHVLKFAFTGRAQFIQQSGEDEVPHEPYLEVEYDTHFELPLVLSGARRSYTVDAEYDTASFGSLARNEFFDCRLEVAMRQIPVDVVSRINTLKDENGDETDSLALKISFNKDLREDWFSFCQDSSGAVLNTQGDAEKYNLEILKLILPQLKSLVANNYNRLENTKIDLDVEPKTINDADISNDIILSGDGTVIIEPL